MRWCREKKVETQLKKMGIDFRWETGIKIADIDIEESLNRQVRVGKKINEDWVVEYGVAMLDPGAEFPGPILNKLSRPERIWIWSGNHRIHAAMSIGEKEVDAYVVSVEDPRVQDLVPRIVNTWEGHSLSREEKLMHAAHLIQTQGLEPKEACILFSLKYEWVVNHMRTTQLSEKIRDLGVNPAGFSKSLLIRMSPVSGDASTLSAVAKFFKKNTEALKQSDQFQILEDMKMASTEKEKVQILKDWEQTVKDRTEKKPVPFKTKIRSRFLGHLTGIRNFLANIEEPGQLQLHPDEIGRVAQYWKETEDKMRQLLKGGA